MSVQDTDERMRALCKLRNKAFTLGGSLGNVFSKTFELVMRVIQTNLEDERVLNYALESLEQERSLAIRHDGEGIDRIEELVFGLSDAVAVMIDGMMAEKRKQTGLPPAPRISPTDSNSESSDTLPQLLRVKEEPDEPPVEVITLDDAPSTSKQSKDRSKTIQKPVFAVPIAPIAGPSTSRQIATGPQTSTPLLKSAIRAASTLRQTSVTAHSRGASVVVPPRIRFSEAPIVTTPSASTKRVRQETTTSYTTTVIPPPSTPTQRAPQELSSPDIKPTLPLPVSSFDVRARAMEEEEQSSSNSAKRRRTFVNYGEDNNDEWEQQSLTNSAPAAVGRRGRYQCDRCDKSFPTNQGLACHVRVHDGVQCTLCKYRMKPAAVPKHMAQKHGVAPGAVASTPTTRLNDHTYSTVAAPSEPAVVVNDEEEMDVNVDVEVNDEDGMEYDSDATEPAASSSFGAEGTWVCDRCDRVFCNAAGLNKHLVVHTGSQCQICKKYMRTEEIAAHMERKHNDGFRAPQPVTPIVRSVFAYAPNHAVESDFEDDSGGEEDEEYRPAGVARGRSRSTSVARPRAASVATPGPFACTQCEKAFQTPGGLAKHSHVHKEGGVINDRERFFCDQCPVSRLSNSLLNHHRRSAHGVHPYECACGISFDMKTMLVEHTRRTGHARAPNSRQSVQPESTDTSRDDRA